MNPGDEVRFICDGHAELNRGDEGIVVGPAAVPELIKVRWPVLGRVIPVRRECLAPK